jgi:5-formaminoimidazole-4-carboxamide-1-(beta)-D-ribofuranosyl 5'-monophosphate synthetase
VEFLGIDRRLQTNLNDFVSYPARQQLEIDVELQNIEIGHMGATIRESMLEEVFEIGETFAKTVKKEYPPGPIGPFALQSVVTVDLDIVVFDVSPRMPGSPILTTTSPYSKYYHGETIGTGRRIAMEIKDGIKQKRLADLVTYSNFRFALCFASSERSEG